MTPETRDQYYAAGQAQAASTEPGPDDPGDLRAERVTLDLDLSLQRSRGRMTPETMRSQ